MADRRYIPSLIWVAAALASAGVFERVTVSIDGEDGDAPFVLDIGRPPAAGSILIGLSDGLPSVVLREVHGEFVSDVTISIIEGYYVAPAALGGLAAELPHPLGVFGEIDSIEPGGRNVWISVGSAFDVRPGNRFWQRQGGQPVARFETLFVDSAVALARCVPLAAGYRPRPGERVELWPSPADRRDGRLRSAVTFVPTGAGGQVWLAAPSGAECPSEPQIDFYRAGRFLGNGALERADERFWYVRPLAASFPVGLQVGDDAEIRTLADVDARRFRARVFSSSGGGALINAGEVDGLEPGMAASAWRADQPLGPVTIGRVETSFSVVDAAGLALLDEVRFGAVDASPPRERVGAVERTEGTELAVARMIDSWSGSFEQRLLVERDGRLVGVALCVAALDGRAVFFCPRELQPARIEPGNWLVR